MSDSIDAVVIGSGPNGLVSAITLARKGWKVTVLERNPVAGGAIHSGELTAPGFTHDTYSAFFGLLHSSPVFKDLALDSRVKWAHFATPVGASIGPETAAVIRERGADTANGLDHKDGRTWQELIEWWDKIGTSFFDQMLAPIGAPGPAFRFLRAAKIRGALDTAKMFLSPAGDVARDLFEADAARALFASGITHTDLGVTSTGSTPMALILAMLAQTTGMPVAVGGSGALAADLVTQLRDLGGVVLTGDAATRVVIRDGRAVAVETASGLSIGARRAVLADTGPLSLCRDLVGESHLPARYLDGLRRFRYGSGIFKVDLALDSPVRWKNPALDDCGVVHLTGSLDDMAASASQTRSGYLPASPLMIVGQQSVADPSRAPKGGSTLWIEMHVPSTPKGDSASTIADPHDWVSAKQPFLERVLSRLESHAPGVRSHIVGTAVRTPIDLERENPNLVGGDLGGGSSAIDMQLIFRPVPGWFRYRTPVKGLYLCSASTHPGGGVHGMCGRNAAERVLRDSRLRRR